MSAQTATSAAVSDKFKEAVDRILENEGFTNLTELETVLAYDIFGETLSAGELGLVVPIEDVFNSNTWKSRRSFGGVLASLVEKGLCRTEEPYERETGRDLALSIDTYKEIEEGVTYEDLVSSAL